ncbi:hypothetical protein CJF31_00001551 [Rutstroemia sp. NJR-2017a BVV2]|nr:hypothetical protein CJF31_00001551 [Rutstroemia sp. NJR-2017a BVV2]
MTTSEYPACYRPLPPGPDNIRLLRLLPNKDESTPVCCQLLDYSLRGFGRRGHQYECLSYCWGSPEKPCLIEIDGVELPITESLNHALIQLRDHSFDRYLWIDAVCINQEDIPEKEQQIQMMAKIYSQARQVVVWLGPEGDDSDRAIELIRLAGAGRITKLDGRTTRLAALLGDDVNFSENPSDESSDGFSEESSDESSVEFSEESSDESSVEFSNDDRGRFAITTLLRRPWFRRVWVLQEVAAAKHVHMVCGTTEIAGYSLCLGVDALKELYEARPQIKSLVYSVSRLIRGGFFRSNTDMVAVNRSSLNIYTLGELLDMYHTHRATLEHDKIYALLAMCSDDVREAGIIPNYGVPWEELLQTVCKYVLGEQVVVRTWPLKRATISMIKGKGIVVGYISEVNPATITNEKQNATLVMVVTPEHKKTTGDIVLSWSFQVSAHPVFQGDLVCHFEASSKLSIIRACKNHFVVIVIAVPPPEVYEWPAMTHCELQQGTIWSDVLRLVENVPVDFVLVWDWMWENNSHHRIPLDNHELQESLRAEEECYEMGVRTVIRTILRDKSLNPHRYISERKHSVLGNAWAVPRYEIFARLLEFNQGIDITEDLLIDIARNPDNTSAFLKAAFNHRPKKSILAEISEEVLVELLSRPPSPHTWRSEEAPMLILLKRFGGDVHVTETVWLAVLLQDDGAYSLASEIVGAQGRIREPITKAMVLAAAGNREEPVKLLEILFKQNEMAGIDSRPLITQAVLKAAKENTTARKHVWEYLIDKQTEYTIKQRDFTGSVGVWKSLRTRLRILKR